MLKLMKFGAAWCQPCKNLEPIWDKISKQHKDVEFVKVDVDVEPDEAVKFHIMSIPTVIFFKDSQEITRRVGIIKEEEFKKIIDSLK